jgi:hypothetical protein
MHKIDLKKNANFLILLILILFTACENESQVPLGECTLPEQQEEQFSSDDNKEPQEPKVCLLPVKAQEANLTIDVQLTDFNEPQEQKMFDALERLEIVINSKEFKQRVLDHEYKGKKTFIDNNGLSNLDIYNIIIQGAETLNEEIDSEIDLDLTLYFKSNSTVGYTYKNTNRIWVNDKFFKDYTLAKVAKNVSHEWIHKLGFGHDKKKTKDRPYSVPYGVGNIIKEMIELM